MNPNATGRVRENPSRICAVHGLQTCWIAALLAFAFQSLADAQERNPEIGSCNEVTVDRFHRLGVVVTPDALDVLERQRFNWLLSDSVRAELDVTEEQIGPLKRLSSHLAAMDRQFTERMWSSLRDESPERRQAIAKRISDESAALRREINEVLLPSQQRRLAQLIARKALCETGLEAALLNDLHVKLNLSESSLAALREQLVAARLSVSAERARQQEQLVREVQNVLSRKQRELVEDRLGKIESYLAPSFELLAWQSRPKGVSEEQSASAVAELTETPEHFRVDLCGRLEASQPSGRDRFRSFQLVCVERTYGDLEMVKFQVAEAAVPSDEMVRQLNVLRGKVGEYKAQLLGGTLPPEKFRMEAEKAAKEFMQWRIDEFVGALLPHQQAELDRIMLRRLVAVRGLHACLIDGRLGTLLELTGEQKKQIADLAGKRAGTLERMAHELETQLWEGVRKAIGDESAGKLDELIGPLSPHLTGCPDLLLQAPADR